MTAADTAPPIQLDRYLALLAILLGLVLALLVIGERDKPPAPPPAVVGTVPPPPDPRLAQIAAEREALMAEQARLAAALEASEAALARARAEAAALAEENERLRRMLGDEGAALDQLNEQLAMVEAERDRLSDEVAALSQTRQRQETRLAELQDALAAARAALAEAEAEAAPPVPSPPASVSAAPSTTPTPGPEATRSPVDEPAAGATGPRPSSPAALAELGLDQGEPAAAPPEAAAEPLAGATPPVAGPPTTGSTTAGPSGLPRRLTTFGSDDATVEDGIEAYRAEDYATAEQIWGALAAAGDRRAQFYFGSLLFEGRIGPPDRVMAHVWLSRSVDNGYLPAIEVRRQVRAAMSEAEYEEALAIEADG